MRSIRISSRDAGVEARAGTIFTGTIWGEVLLPPVDGATLNRVTFAPRARTFWHRHEAGQMLIGLAGSGLVVTRSGALTPIGAGVVVHACPQEEHWHGALPDVVMTHLACQLGGRTVWLEEVSEHDYLRAVEQVVTISERSIHAE
jgi:quercetin dioxygenase-like cupin family protein